MDSKYTIHTISLSAMFFCFNLLMIAQPGTTPDAPDVNIEYDSGLMTITLSNDSELSNNYLESYEGLDANLPELDNQWLFEGYLVYQLLLGFSELDFLNPDVARLVGQCDVDNEYDQLLNTYYSDEISQCAPVIMVEGSNNGINFSFELEEDMWTGQAFVEGEVYCYMALAYATHPDGETEFCPGLPYQFIRSSQSANGGLEIQCKTASDPVGLSEQESSSDFVVYPNPACDVINLEIEQGDIGLITISDIHGHQVYVEESLGRSYVKIDISSLSSGVYVVQYLGTSVSSEILLVNR